MTICGLDDVCCSGLTVADEAESVAALAFFRTELRSVLVLDAFLQLQNHRTGRVDDFNIVPASQLVRFRRFSVGP